LLTPANQVAGQSNGVDFYGLGFTPKNISSILHGAGSNVTTAINALVNPDNWNNLVRLLTPANQVAGQSNGVDFYGLGFTPQNISSILNGAGANVAKNTQIICDMSRTLHGRIPTIDKSLVVASCKKIGTSDRSLDITSKLIDNFEGNLPIALTILQNVKNNQRTLSSYSDQELERIFNIINQSLQNNEQTIDNIDQNSLINFLSSDNASQTLQEVEQEDSRAKRSRQQELSDLEQLNFEDVGDFLQTIIAMQHPPTNQQPANRTKVISQQQLLQQRFHGLGGAPSE
jgi:hypothetical protein